MKERATIMKIKSKFCILLAGICFIFSACSVLQVGNSGKSKSGLDPKNPITVNLWHYYVSENKKTLEEAVAEFNQTVGAEKGIVVVSLAKGSIKELEEAVTASAKGIIGSDPMPEIFSGYPDKALEIDELGMLVDLNDYFTEEEQSRYMTDFVKAGTSCNGKLLTLPIVKSTELLYVNKNAWEDFLLENPFSEKDLEVWEDILEVSRAYYRWTDEKTPETIWDGRSLMGVDVLSNYIVIGSKQLGAELIDADTRKARLDAEALQTIFDVYVTGMSMGYFNSIGRFRSDDVKSGDLVAYAGSSSGAAYFPTWIAKNNAQEDIELLALKYPKFASGKQYVAQQGAGMCIAKTTPQKQEGAAIFLKWFTEKSKNVDFAMNSGYLPVNREFYEKEAFREYLTTMSQGDQTAKNLKKVYEIALEQVMDTDTYSPKPFEGSYDIRRILENTLKEETEKVTEQVRHLQMQGQSEEEIWLRIDRQKSCMDWLASVQKALKEKGIDCELVQQ